LDEYGNFTGQRASREEVHKLGLVHRAVHLYLVDEKGHLLMQKRAKTVDHYSNEWSISLTGHVDTVESSSAALYREVREKLSLDPTTMKFEFLFSYRQDYILCNSYIDRQFNNIYFCRYPFVLEDIHFNTNEVAGLMHMPLSQFKATVKNENSFLSKIYAEECAALEYLGLL
jgi:isopentenyldiphosphate isomerase